MAKYNIAQLSKFIDHTNLKANATSNDILRLCDEAKKYNFASVCFNQVKSCVAANELRETGIKACSVIGFPLGQTSINSKICETKDALNNGANEIDYVINISEAKEGNWDYIQKEMQAIVDICKGYNIICKAIFENHYLTKDEIKKLCDIAAIVKPGFVKTSTGTTPGGATAEDIALMASSTPAEVLVKASGGIRDADTFVEMIKQGASRIGASASIAIIEEIKVKYFSNGEEYLEI